jgi:hypothetical protein
VDIGGATSAMYTLVSGTAGDSGAQFTVTVTNSTGVTATSSAATLTVKAPPAITVQPLNPTVVTHGSTATFTVTATGAAPLTYRWFRNGALITGATGSSYTTPVTTLANNGVTYIVVISNSIGSVTSNPATLTVN